MGVAVLDCRPSVAEAEAPAARVERPSSFKPNQALDLVLTTQAATKSVAIKAIQSHPTPVALRPCNQLPSLKMCDCKT